ncbi:hypothetical protein GLAREA_00097 [Glarea lozoyensis ATCC 20868]|uniref:SnoaL-like domain-containing protein n=1 Tax=Glarea lozoyensis (strain ATCC 20868 / MF5171) TaxID=1116229 RepID=S3CVF7_GLAL2|nr:uncharacterized protein GLAREA_00097 [Glarea lozoyensis ATCC 20868]EPE28939.1 hypothetical protein GLAREA_00097 [Glarea lozoyensis ATCC 20868]
MSFNPPSDLESLESYLQTLLYDLSVQPSDAIFRKTLEKNVPKSFEGLINGEPKDYDSLLKLTLMQRHTFTSLVILKQEFAVIPKDTEGKTGTVFHGWDLSAVQNGKVVKARARCVFEIGWHKGHRVVESGNCVNVVD